MEVVCRGIVWLVVCWSGDVLLAGIVVFIVDVGVTTLVLLLSVDLSGARGRVRAGGARF